MRILFANRCAKHDGTSSLSNVPRLVLHRMLQEDPHLHVTWAVPRGSDPEQLNEFLLSPLPEANRRQLRWRELNRQGFDRMIGYWSTEELWQEFNQAQVDLPYDLVITQQASLIPTYRALLAARARASQFTTTVPMVHWGLWTATFSQMEEVPEYYMGESDVVSELTGCWSADLNIFESKYLLQDAVRSMKRWMLPATVRRFAANATHVHVGVEMARLDEVYAKRRQRFEQGDPALLWGGRFAGQKKPRVSFPLMRDLQLAQATRARRVPVLVSSSQPIPEWATREYPDWRMEGGLNRDAWFDRIALGDVFICNSVSEGYGTAWLEMLGAGMLGVFERSWWNEQLLPSWYPFVADSKEQQVVMARMLIEQWPDGLLWDKYVPMVREWMHSEQSDAASGPRMLELLRSQADKALVADEAIGRGSVGQLAVKAAHAAREALGQQDIPEQQVWARMAELSDSDRAWGGRKDLVTRSYLRRALQTNGWADVGVDEVVFREIG